MRRILLGAVAGVLLLEAGTRAADALGIGRPRLRRGCTETCWCKRPGLTVFRWVTPGRWHQIGLTAEEKRSQHSQGMINSGCGSADEPGAPWAFVSERVTGIEPALSAWESDRSEPLTALSWAVNAPLVTVMDPAIPGLMARQWPAA
jgi:hypothetical protein